MTTRFDISPHADSVTITIPPTPSTNTNDSLNPSTTSQHGQRQQILPPYIRPPILLNWGIDSAAAQNPDDNMLDNPVVNANRSNMQLMIQMRRGLAGMGGGMTAFAAAAAAAATTGVATTRRTGDHLNSNTGVSAPPTSSPSSILGYGFGLGNRGLMDRDLGEREAVNNGDRDRRSISIEEDDRRLPRASREQVRQPLDSYDNEGTNGTGDDDDDDDIDADALEVVQYMRQWRRRWMAGEGTGTTTDRHILRPVSAGIRPRGGGMDFDPPVPPVPLQSEPVQVLHHGDLSTRSSSSVSAIIPSSVIPVRESTIPGSTNGLTDFGVALPPPRPSRTVRYILIRPRIAGGTDTGVTMDSSFFNGYPNTPSLEDPPSLRGEGDHVELSSGMLMMRVNSIGLNAAASAAMNGALSTRSRSHDEDIYLVGNDTSIDMSSLDRFGNGGGSITTDNDYHNIGTGDSLPSLTSSSSSSLIWGHGEGGGESQQTNFHTWNHNRLDATLAAANMIAGNRRLHDAMEDVESMNDELGFNFMTNYEGEDTMTTSSNSAMGSPSIPYFARHRRAEASLSGRGRRIHRSSERGLSNSTTQNIPQNRSNTTTTNTTNVNNNSLFAASGVGSRRVNPLRNNHHTPFSASSTSSRTWTPLQVATNPSRLEALLMSQPLLDGDGNPCEPGRALTTARGFGPLRISNENGVGLVIHGHGGDSCVEVDAFDERGGDGDDERLTSADGMDMMWWGCDVNGNPLKNTEEVVKLILERHDPGAVRNMDDFTHLGDGNCQMGDLDVGCGR
ncbi:hypothetical protein HDU76_013926 [Blyttiomyces sp. JEL0837]|nr:hypothetical protein HDU76_013926 [Blyttiomyces sp. JEL0837]